MSRDMTQGNISRTLIYFSVPLMLSGLLQQLYNWADALIVGNFVGEGALAAIGATGTVSGVLLTVISGFSVGVSIMVAQAYGSGEREGVGSILSLFTILLGTVGLLIALAGIFIVRPALDLLHTPGDIITMSADYLRIILIGIPFMSVYNVYSAVLRGIGDSRTPLLAIIVSSLANVALDLLFVAVMNYGVAGAAYATIIAQILMTFFVMAYTSKKHKDLRLSFGKPVDRSLLSRGLRLSVPTAVQSTIRSLGSLLLQSIMNSFGSLTVAAITTAYRIDSIGMLPVTNLGAGITTFAAQNKGAAKLRRARQGLRVGVSLALGVALLITVSVVLCGEPLLGLFGISADAISIGQGLLLRLAVFYPLFGLVSAVTGYLQGMGEVTFVGLTSIAALAVRVAASYLFAPLWGNMVIAYAEVFAWTFQLLVCSWRYWSKYRRGDRDDGVVEAME